MHMGLDVDEGLDLNLLDTSAWVFIRGIYVHVLSTKISHAGLYLLSSAICRDHLPEYSIV